MAMREVKVVEREVELAMFAKERSCAECGLPMGWDGIQLQSSPPQYRLLCPAGCGYAIITEHPQQALTRKREEGR